MAKGRLKPPRDDVSIIGIAESLNTALEGCVVTLQQRRHVIQGEDRLLGLLIRMSTLGKRIPPPLL